jgi:hypothetical protein
MLWFLPSFHGDIRLKRLGDMSTELSWLKLTAKEIKALTELSEYAAKKGWTADKIPLDGENKGIELRVPLVTLQKYIARRLKPERSLIDVVSFADGSVTEVVREEIPKEATKATTVAKPTQGCPAPNFPAAELRAREVLFAFLTPEQQDDFNERNAFISTGAATGHRYVITSRHAKDELAVRRRQLYDLDDGHPFCVHDYAVPAAEEMLALHLMLQLPQHEPYLRHLE